MLPQVRLAALERNPDTRRARAEALVARFPGSPEALVFRARVLRDDGGAPEARRAAALAAVAAAPDSVDALTAHAIEELGAGNAEGALVTVSHAAELEPWNSSVYVVRSLVLGAIGRCDEAAIEAQRAIDVLPDNPTPADLRALVQEQERNHRGVPGHDPAVTVPRRRRPSGPGRPRSFVAAPSGSVPRRMRPFSSPRC